MKDNRLYTTMNQVFYNGPNGQQRALIWGYEYNDGTNACGSPPSTYKGWFYSIRLEGSGEELIVPQSVLAPIKVQRIIEIPFYIDVDNNTVVYLLPSERQDKTIVVVEEEGELDTRYMLDAELKVLKERLES